MGLGKKIEDKAKEAAKPVKFLLLAMLAIVVTNLLVLLSIKRKKR